MRLFAPSVVFLLVNLAVASSLFAEANPDDHWSECRASDTCNIDSEYFSNQESHPFLFLGEEVAQGHPKWRAYNSAIRKYSSVVDCLTTDEQSQPNPNLLRFDWLEVGVSREAEVCLFRIADSLGTEERLAKWLEFHGFIVTGPTRILGEGSAPIREKEPVSRLSGSWKIDQYRKVNPSALASLVGIDTVKSFGVNVRYDQHDQVVGADVFTRSKLN